MTIIVEKAYLVLSIREIKKLLAAAKADRKKYSGKSTDNHCVVLDNLRLASVNGQSQVLSSSLSEAVRNIAEGAKPYRVKSATPLAAEVAQAALEAVRATGGATVNTRTGDIMNNTYGYGLSVNPEAELKVREVSRAVIARFIVRNSIQLAQSDKFLGIWLNKSDGFWYLDVSTWIPNLDEAKAAGRAAKQIAIWDCAAGKEILL